jgi:hypothetical protein
MNDNEHYHQAVDQLLAKIGAKHPPEMVESQPAIGAALKNCFYNVPRQVEKSGGGVVYGWAIGLSHFLVEAEKHAVWQTPEGKLIDITPRIPVMPSILFVRDGDFVYTGQYVDNVRLNITANPVVDDWIEICEGMEVLYSYGQRKNEHEIGIPENIVPFLNHLEDLKIKYGGYLNAGGNPDALCFCGRPMVYKGCHGADMSTLKSGLEKVRLLINAHR